MKKPRKFLAIIIALLITAFVLFGSCECYFLPEPTVNDATTLTLLAKKSNVEDTDYMKRIISRYKEKTGKEVRPILIPDADFEKVATRMFKEGRIPDMLLHFNDSNLIHFDTANNFYDLREYGKQKGWFDDITETVLDDCMDSGGRMIGLPFWENSVSGCYYNKTLFDEYGVTYATTQNEFDALCDMLKKSKETPLYWGASDCHWMFQFGLDPIFADNPELLARLNSNKARYANIAPVVELVEWFDRAAKAGWFNADYASKGWKDLPAAMGSGEAAMIFCWDTWFFANLPDDKNVDRGGEYKYTMKDFALMPVFMDTVEGGTYEGGNLNMIMVNKNGKKRDLALEFLDFCMRPENYNVAFDGVPTARSFNGQTTIVQAKMVTDVLPSVEANRRPSTAWARIIGYRQEDVGEAMLKLFKREIDVNGCIKLMDDARIAAAKEFGAAGF